MRRDTGEVRGELRIGVGGEKWEAREKGGGETKKQFRNEKTGKKLKSMRRENKMDAQ